MDDDDEDQRVEVPYRELSSEALRGLIEEFVLREGTEYGARDFTLEEKVAQVLLQLEKGEVRVLFDLATESANIAPRN
jgi:uncharacterized protein YheU (UPF0270 family)